MSKNVDAKLKDFVKILRGNGVSEEQIQFLVQQTKEYYAEYMKDEKG